MARWMTKLSLVGLGAALLVGGAGCVVETTEANYYTSCADDLDCDIDLTCLAVNGTNICTSSCVSDLDCPSPGQCAATTTGGGVCAILSGPTPPPPPPPPPSELVFYEPGCGPSTPCISSAQCLVLTNDATGETDSVCSGGCALDSDCGSNGWCILQYASSSICFQACSTDTDCYAGWHCEQIEDFETKELVPACIPGW